MKVEIIRTPGLDLVHDLAAKGVEGPVEVPKDLVEGDVKDVDDDVAEALIAVGVAKAADKADKADKAARHAPAPKPAAHTPEKKPEHNPPAK